MLRRALYRLQETFKTQQPIKKTISVSVKNISIITDKTDTEDSLLYEATFVDLMLAIQHSPLHLAYLCSLRDPNNNKNYLFSGTEDEPGVGNFSPFFSRNDKTDSFRKNPETNKYYTVDQWIEKKLSRILTELNNKHDLPPLDEAQEAPFWPNIAGVRYNTKYTAGPNQGKKISATEVEDNFIKLYNQENKCKLTINCTTKSITYKKNVHWFDKLFANVALAAVTMTLLIGALSAIENIYGGFPLFWTTLALGCTFFFSFEELLKTTETKLERFARTLRRFWMGHTFDGHEHHDTFKNNLYLVAWTVAMVLGVGYLVYLQGASTMSKNPAPYIWFKDRLSHTINSVGILASRILGIVFFASKPLDAIHKKKIGLRNMKATYTIKALKRIKAANGKEQLDDPFVYMDEFRETMTTAITGMNEQQAAYTPGRYHRRQSLCTRLAQYGARSAHRISRVVI